MEQCPKCGCYMTYYIAYHCGYPVSGYKCTCGYDSNANIVYAASIMPKPE